MLFFTTACEYLILSTKISIKNALVKLCLVENVLSPVTFRLPQLPIFRGFLGAHKIGGIMDPGGPNRKESEVPQETKSTEQELLCYFDLTETAGYNYPKF